jgi:hypothetical protein
MNLLPVFAVIGLSGGSPYPIAEVLSVARHGCQIALTSEDAGAALASAGWAPIDPKPDSWIAESLRDESMMLGPDSKPSRVYASKAADRILFAFVNTARTGKGDLRLCTIQDPKATIETAPEEILAWAGRAPTSTALVSPDLERQIQKLSFIKAWEPGLHEGADDTVIRYLPVEYSTFNSGLTFSSERLVRKEAQ